MRHSLYLDRPNARLGLRTISRKISNLIQNLYDRFYTNDDNSSSNIDNYSVEPERYIDRFDRKSSEYPRHDEVNIPFIESKKRKLTNAGLATGAVLSTNLLDSIAKYATIERLPIKTAIGLAVKESTLGNPTDDSSIYQLMTKENANYVRGLGTGQHINPGEDVDARLLLNYYKDTWNPYNEAIEYAKNKANKLLINPDKDNKRRSLEEYDLDMADYYKRYDQVVDSILKAGERYADNQAKKKSSSITGNVMQAAFRDYKNNPNGYNPAQTNYQELVNRRADEVWNSPEIQEWYKNYISKRNGGRVSLETL